MRKLLLGTLCILLTSCASIPLGTMLEFSSFDETRLLAIEPKDVRVKVILDKPIQLKADDTILSLGLDLPDGIRLYKFRLRLLDVQNIPPEEGIFFSTTAKTQSTLMLSTEAIEQFKAVQQLLKDDLVTKGSDVTFAINAGFDLNEGPNVAQSAAPSEVTISILLQLAADTDFVVLIDDAKLGIIDKR